MKYCFSFLAQMAQFFTPLFVFTCSSPKHLPDIPSGAFPSESSFLRPPPPPVLTWRRSHRHPSCSGPFAGPLHGAPA